MSELKILLINSIYYMVSGILKSDWSIAVVRSLSSMPTSSHPSTETYFHTADSNSFKLVPSCVSVINCSKNEKDFTVILLHCFFVCFFKWKLLFNVLERSYNYLNSNKFFMLSYLAYLVSWCIGVMMTQLGFVL